MRKIYAIGETVFDIIFKNDQPRAAKPGGAMLNSAVSLGRIGLPVSFISEYGDDNVGSLIDRFLNDNGVNTSHIDHFTEGKTGLALAFLDEKNDASYTFYKNYPDRRLEIQFPDILKDDLILCGSIYAITPDIRTKFRSFTEKSATNGAIVVYDPNFRKAHSSDLEKLLPLMIENMQVASIVRGSDEDFRNICGAATPDEAWAFVSKFSGCLVYTASSEGVYVRTVNFSGKFPVRQIDPVSTIGAGDNFNAGMIAAIYLNGISAEQIDKMGEEKWSKVIFMGVDFATDVCMSYENYVSAEFAAGMRANN